MKIIIGCDQNGFELKECLRLYIRGNGFDVTDAGVYDRNPVDYPDIALQVAQKIAEERYDRGILVCGTGIGMAIAANKVPGIRAALCTDPYSAEHAIKSNNAQIMTLGAFTIGEAVAKKLIDIWLSSEYDPSSPSNVKVEKISSIEHRYMK